MLAFYSNWFFTAFTSAYTVASGIAFFLWLAMPLLKKTLLKKKCPPLESKRATLIWKITMYVFGIIFFVCIVLAPYWINQKLESRINVNEAHLFWAGHDLRWTMDLLHNGGSGKDIVKGLCAAEYQMYRVNWLLNSGYHDKVSRLYEDAKKLKENAWTDEKMRSPLTKRVDDLVDDIERGIWKRYHGDYTPPPCP